MQRRALLKSALTGAVLLAVRPALGSARSTDDPAAALARLEQIHGGRLGVAILDIGNGNRIAHRGDERFLMCSTFKLLLAAVVLHRVDRGEEMLDRRVVFGKDVLLDYAPVTSRHVGPPGMTVAELCHAAITLSDNTAANLLLRRIGGPQAVTSYARSLGDPLTRLDRAEPTLNRRDGEKDTTTPWAMLRDMQKLLLGDALSATSRGQLTKWLLANRTGGKSLRAGLPPGWREGDKTGSGNTAANDVAILWPPRREPLLVAAYYEDATTPPESRYAVLKEVGRVVATVAR